MKRLSVALGVSFWALLPLSQAAASVGDLSWLAGCWRQQMSYMVIEESWLAPDGGMLVGVGRTVGNGTLRSFEYMRIETVAGIVTFTAKPSGQDEASFGAIKQTPTEIVFENKAHDFPQRVTYRTTGKNSLEAAIEGEVAGQLKTIKFAYNRCP